MTGQLILSIGEAMVELSEAGQPGHWRLGIAGDTLNTAWYLRRLLPADWRVSYCSRVGQGEFSQKMLDFLAAEGIGADHVTRDPRREIALYAISLKDGERSVTARGADPDTLVASAKAYLSALNKLSAAARRLHAQAI